MARRRGFESLSDMVRSMGLVLLAVAVVVLITLRQAPDQAAPTVDPATATAAASSAAVLPVPTVPQPAGWRITSARYEPGPPARLSVGYQTPGDGFAGWTVTNGEVADAVAAVAPEAVEVESEPSADVDGWTVWTAADREVWTQTSGEFTVVLVATEGSAQLRTLATALSSV